MSSPIDKYLYGNKVLELPLEGKWYDMIESGAKKEEYRALKPYWVKRIFGCKRCRSKGKFPVEPVCLHCIFLGSAYRNNWLYNRVRFRFGYTKRTMTYKIKFISVGRGKPEWGADTENKVIIIEIGERID